MLLTNQELKGSAYPKLTAAIILVALGLAVALLKLYGADQETSLDDSANSYQWICVVYLDCYRFTNAQAMAKHH